MDLRSLENRQLPEDLFTVSYNGIVTPRLSVEGRYSARHQTFIGSGARSRDLIDGTLVIDQQRGNRRYWSPTFCGVCTDEQRDNENVFVKGTYFLSTRGLGTHTLAAGYDNFNDMRLANNHQSGSDYRVLGTTSIVQGTDIFPVSSAMGPPSQALESGVPYGAGGQPIGGGNANGVDPREYVPNPGYATPPPGSAVAYYYMPRDAFRTEGQRRTDFSTQYVYRLPGAGGVQLFGNLQVLNIFNQAQLCGCGGSVFANGGAVTSTNIDQTVRTSVTTPAVYQPFNPFIDTPVQGVNWDYGPNFGQALNRFAYTTPRMFRLSFGVRF